MDRAKLKRILIIAAIAVLAAAYLMALASQQREEAMQAQEGGNVLPSEQSQQIAQSLEQSAQHPAVPAAPPQDLAQAPPQESAPAPPEDAVIHQAAVEGSGQAPADSQQPRPELPQPAVSEPQQPQEPGNEYLDVSFRSKKLLNDHYEKHGRDMGFKSAADYEAAARDVVNAPEALHKTEKEDGDDVYYLEATNEFVVVSKDGYIRTYFLPDSGKKYYDKQ
jgi:hypothetical protein